MGMVVAIANQKGGVGKTTTTVNLAASLAAFDRTVLLLDLDPQGNATQGVGIEKNALDRTVYDALVNGCPLTQVIQGTGMERFDAAPANRDLVGAEVELIEVENRLSRLRQALAPVRNKYDYILVDCPPSLSLLTVNGLVAADQVLITLQCEYFALEGLSELLKTVIRVRDQNNSALSIFGVLLTMYQNTNLSKQVLDDVRDHLGKKVFNTIIPRNVTLSEAPSFGQPAMYYDLKSAGAQAYLALAREVMSRG
jgi:chromosome partitioning protein